MTKPLPRGIEIELVHQDSRPPMYGLHVNGELVVITVCSHHARKLAQKFDRARSLPRREAMHFLTDTLGFCDLTAETVFNLLHFTSPTTEARH